MRHVTEFTNGYHRLNQLMTTSFPFPLVQKIRTILFACLFTLSLSLLKDDSTPWEDMAMIFFASYGFLGLDINIELSDSFGDDDNFFNILGMDQRVYENIHMSLHELDGWKPAESLQNTISKAQSLIKCSEKIVKCS